jgi:hypothetical protein
MLQIVGGWGGEIVIPMPEALSFAESRRQKDRELSKNDIKNESRSREANMDQYFSLTPLGLSSPTHVPIKELRQ